MKNSSFHSLSRISKKKLLKELKDFKIYYKDSLDLPKKATFGCEIEFKLGGYNNMNCPTQMNEDDFVNCLLKEKGYDFPFNIKSEMCDLIEVISPVLSDYASSWKELKNVLNFLKQNGAYCNEFCAAHVHIGKQLVGNDINSWLMFFKLWSVFEEEIIKFTNGEYYFSRSYRDFYARKSSNILKTFLNNEIDENSYLPIELCVKNSSISFTGHTIGDLIKSFKNTYI